jgi:hypothetical protein
MSTIGSLEYRQTTHAFVCPRGWGERGPAIGSHLLDGNRYTYFFAPGKDAEAQSEDMRILKALITQPTSPVATPLFV